jgi:thymidylate synthase (FAD)
MKIVPIKVELIDKMGDDVSVVNAARVSFAKESEWKYSPEGKVLGDGDKKLIRYLAEHNHWSPFSHAYASFRIKAPIFVARQLVKHTVGLSWNEVSRRYVSTEPEFYLPKTWRKAADNVKQGSSDETIELLNFNGRMDDSQRIEDHVERVCFHALTVYERMLEAGVCAEQARMILPQNMMTEWIWSGSLYAFARVCNLRLDSHTQLETQTVAKLIDAYMIELFPESWNVLVK